MAQDITSLEKYDDFVEAKQNLANYREERKAKEKEITSLFDQSKAKRKEAEMADSFQKMEQLESEADSLLQQAKDAQTALDTWENEQPHFGNLLGSARQALDDEARPFINNLMDQAKSEIDDAMAALEAINSSKNKFSSQTLTWIPSVSGIINELIEVKNRVKL